MALLKDHLIAHYKLNDNLPTDVILDETGNYNGTVKDATGTATSTFHSVAGKIIRAQNFDGVDDYIDCGDIGINGLSVLSMGCWIKTTELGPNHLILSAGKDIAGKFGFGFGVQNNKMRVIMADPAHVSAYVNEVSSKTINDGVWHFLFMTLGDSVIRYYIDGNEDTNSPLAAYATIHASVDKLMIGNSPYTTYYYKDIIDNVMLFNKEIILNEIKYLYNGGAGTENIPIGIENQLSRTGQRFSSFPEN